ncbi:hypothetical protein [Helicobacter anatolicus]|uniref:hypothetical protein n=1 Tax=Helicobacter anatolicus TaxID=2905874 RepID=UPI001E3E97ED|nr:hypothetical protein [Helicobacter anatolicus]MCE3040269.1 hypothetical protein [Helicobacter anatolicus]
MKLHFEEQLQIAVTTSIIAKYGVFISTAQIGQMLDLNERSVLNKISRADKDLPKFTKFKGRHIVMAQDLADFMLNNNLCKI